MNYMENNQKFDATLSQYLECASLPCDVLKQVNPWMTIFKQMMWGYVLMWLGAICLDFAPRYPEKPWLSLLGNSSAILCYVLLYVCFRSLRNVNHWFRFCWIVKMLDLLHAVAEIGLGQLYPGSSEPPVWFGVLFRSIFYLCLWWGILSVQRACSLSRLKSPAHLVLVYYTLLILLPALEPMCRFFSPNLADKLAPLFMLFSYIFTISIFAIFCTLSQIPKYLDQIGYALPPAPARLSPVPLCILCIAVTMGLRVVCMAAFGTALL